MFAANCAHDTALAEKPRWLVLNKLDLVPEEERSTTYSRFLKGYGPVERHFEISAITGEGCRALTFALQDLLDAKREERHQAALARFSERRRQNSLPNVKRFGWPRARLPNRLKSRHLMMKRRRTHYEDVAQERQKMVVKVGSALVTYNGDGLDRLAMADWARQIAQLRHEGKAIALSSLPVPLLLECTFWLAEKTSRDEPSTGRRRCRSNGLDSSL